MAKKKLNKKVALIGSLVFVILGIGAVVVVLNLSRDPHKFIQDADDAIKAGDEATDEEARDEYYEIANHNYHRARHRSKDDELTVEILHKLANLYIKRNDWEYVRGCWINITRLDPKDARARCGLLKFSYIMAINGSTGFWKEIESQVTEFLEVADEQLLAADPDKWKPFEIQDRSGGRRIDSYLYLLRGRAKLTMTELKFVNDPELVIDQTIEDLKKVQQIEPDNVDAYRFLARAIIEKGQIFASLGNIEEKNKAMKQAEEILGKALEVAPDNPQAQINLLTMKPAFTQMTTEQRMTLEPEYLALVDKFPSSHDAYASLSFFYSTMGHKYLDKSIDSLEKAVELDNDNVSYTIQLANLFYRKFSIYAEKEALLKAIDIATGALTLPDTLDTPGPRNWANKTNRHQLYSFLAYCYIEQLLKPSIITTESQKQQWLKYAEDTVHEIEQIAGSGEDPQVVKWQGMLELAKGENRTLAIKKLYATYEQLKASDRKDRHLSYVLANEFKNTNEIGAAKEFMESAMFAYMNFTHPDIFLDYVEVLLKLSASQSYNYSLSIINSFEGNYGQNERSRSLKIVTYIAARQFADAEEELAKASSNDPNMIRLNTRLLQAKITQIQAEIAQKQRQEGQGDTSSAVADKLMNDELTEYKEALAKLLQQMLSTEPNFIEESVFNIVCGHYLQLGKTEEAKTLITDMLKYFPDHMTIQFYDKLVAEPDPANVSLEKVTEIQKTLLSEITNPIRQAVSLGTYYQKTNDPNTAIEEFKKALDMAASAENGHEAEDDKNAEDYKRIAAGYLAEFALNRGDAELADYVTEVAKAHNLDDCQGNYYGAIFDIIKQQHKDALAKLDECLNQRPVFSRGYMLRSKVKETLGDEHGAIADAKRAAAMNPLDKQITEVLALALYRRNLKLGANATPDQVTETKVALRTALYRNPSKWQLLSLYAEYISAEDPNNDALAIRQKLQKVVPSLENALLLAKMAMRIAINELDRNEKQGFFEIAASALEEARAMAPQNQSVLNAYSEYYRITGQPEKAQELLTQAEDKRLLYVHHFRLGQFEEAKNVLQQLYDLDPKDASVVTGLLLVAEKTTDIEAVKRFAAELLILDDSIENQLLQIQSFLRTGLIDEAEHKIQSAKERYPDETNITLFEAWLAMRLGKLEEALVLVNRCLETDQNNVVAWRLRGEISLFLAKYDQAIASLNKSKTLIDEPVTRLTLAKAYLRAGRNEAANAAALLFQSTLSGSLFKVSS